MTTSTPKATPPPGTQRSATPLAELARDVLTIPTASYLEHHVIDFIRRFAEQRDLDFRQDEYGNAYVTYRRGPQRRPLVLGAHTDHPGFVVSAVEGRRLRLEFRAVPLPEAVRLAAGPILLSFIWAHSVAGKDRYVSDPDAMVRLHVKLFTEALRQ